MRILINKKIFLILLTGVLSLPVFGQSIESSNNFSASLKLSDRHSQLKEKNEKVYRYFIFNDTIKIKNKKSVKLSKDKSKIHPVRLSLVLGGMFTGWLGMHIYYTHTWWKNKAHYFKFDEDNYYARDVDKLSHIYTANLISAGSDELYKWTGLNPTLSMALGSATAILYETYIEINDGFSPDWGFDWGDMTGNFIGALYPVAQRYVPFLRTINFKWSFKPTWLEKKFRNYPDLLDDYTGMKFWITFNPYDILPKKMQKWYPAFLGYGLGITLQNASHVFGSANAYRDFYLAFDIDITKLPGKTGFLKALKRVLNFYHIPTPGIRISNGVVWYGLLF